MTVQVEDNKENIGIMSKAMGLVEGFKRFNKLVDVCDYKFEEVIDLQNIEVPEEGEAVSRFQVLKVIDRVHPVFGKVNISMDDLNGFVKSFDEKARGIDIAVDQEHDAGQATGWVKGLDVEGDSLYATVEWTELGIPLLKKKIYKYVSAEFSFGWRNPTDKKLHKNVLLGIALTNRPFLNDLEEISITFEEAMKQGIQFSVIPYKKTPLADIGESWDAGVEVKAADVKDLKVMCTWYDKENSDVKGSYKLPHHKAEGYATIWKGVAAAMGALKGARGGVDIPEADKKGVYNHLKKHYGDFEKEAPEFEELSEEVKVDLKEVKEIPDKEAIHFLELSERIQEWKLDSLQDVKVLLQEVEFCGEMYQKDWTAESMITDPFYTLRNFVCEILNKDLGDKEKMDLIKPLIDKFPETVMANLKQLYKIRKLDEEVLSGFKFKERRNENMSEKIIEKDEKDVKVELDQKAELRFIEMEKLLSEYKMKAESALKLAEDRDRKLRFKEEQDRVEKSWLMNESNKGKILAPASRDLFAEVYLALKDANEELAKKLDALMTSGVQFVDFREYGTDVDVDTISIDEKIQAEIEKIRKEEKLGYAEALLKARRIHLGAKVKEIV